MNARYIHGYDLDVDELVYSEISGRTGRFVCCAKRTVKESAVYAVRI